MVLVEAQANGLPCLATTAVPKIVKVLDCVDFKKVDESIDEWVITIEKLTKCCDYRNSKISLNEKFEKKGYSIEKEKDKLVGYYQMYFNLNSDITTLPLSISECRDIQLTILREIDNFAKINGLRYSLGYGSMLGAVRHKGFIPWDDDIDIIMPREDYEKFKSKYKSDLYEIVSSDSDGYFYPFMKLVDKNTYVKMADNATIHGIWIDIFPIDKIPNNPFFRKIFLLRSFWLRSLLISATTDFSEKIIKKKKLKRFLKILCEIFGKQNVVKHYEKLNKKYVSKNKKYFSCLSSPYTLKEVYDADELFDNLKKYEFENYEFNGINNYDSYLKMLYGDYMKLPSFDKRRTHRIEAWRLDDEKRK